MLRFGLAIALVAATALAALAPSFAAPAATRSRCQRLKGHDLAPSRTVKLVKTPNEWNGNDLVGCVLPRGRLVTVAARRNAETQDNRYAIKRVSGAIVLVHSTFSSQYGVSENTVVTDLRSGATARIALFEQPLGDPASYGERSLAAFTTKSGRSIAATLDTAGMVTIARFVPGEPDVVLDSGPLAELPPGSLVLVGYRATWSHGGDQHSADI